jgi:hypothetical protein
MTAALALALAAPAPSLEAAPASAIGVDVSFRLDLCGPRGSIGPRLRIARDRRCEPVHRHSWQLVHERQWVAPLWRDAVVGYDHCGRPILRPTLIRAGYWTTVAVRTCGCGQRVRC